MSSFLFLGMLIGVAWICAWSIFPQDRERPMSWWPFDMRDQAPKPRKADEPGWRGLRRAAAPRASAPAASVPPPAAPTPRRATPASWRDRRTAARRERGQ